AWTVELTVDVPGPVPSYDSFQAWMGSLAWLDRTQCRFESGAGENTRTLRPDPLYTQVAAVSPIRAVVRYQFTQRGNAGVPMQDIAAWRLVCRFPGRVVEASVPFTFRDLELP